MIKLQDSGAGIYGIMRNGKRIGTAYMSMRYRPARHIPVGFVATVRLHTGKKITIVDRTIPAVRNKIIDKVK